jgi:sensor c-di-GMP phosphodiesterase-like protein
MSFAAGIAAGDTNSERIARALLGLAEGLSLDTVAEGVETPDVASVLAEQGWQHGQGWLYGHARPAPDILAGR